MSRLLAMAVEAGADGDETARRKPGTLTDRQRKERAIAMGRPLGHRVLAWCDANPGACRGASSIVADLRAALRSGDYFHQILVALYGEVPEAMAAEAEARP